MYVSAVEKRYISHDKMHEINKRCHTEHNVTKLPYAKHRLLGKLKWGITVEIQEDVNKFDLRIKASIKTASPSTSVSVSISDQFHIGAS